MTQEIQTSKKELRFPEGFLWGSSTAAHQIEGNNFNNDWWKFEQEGGGKEPSGLACDQYHLYEKDFDLIGELHQNAHRFSIEWSRIEPEEGRFNVQEIEHYRQVLKSLKARNIKTMVTLFHFTLPLWLAKMGGFANSKSVFYFSRFARRMLEEYKDLVDFWATLNEPLVYAAAILPVLKGEITYAPVGAWPPSFKANIKSVLRLPWVVKNLIASHKKVYEIFHQSFASGSPIKIGVVKQNSYFEPFNPSLLLDRITAKVIDYVWNRYFLDRIKDRLDFIGLNYYLHYRIQFPFRVRNENKVLSDIGWEVFPEGIYHVAKELQKYRVPIYITENGVADGKDQIRKNFIRDHLFWLHRAISEGTDVRGYFHWSLIDNFEWEKGFYPRFGLIEVDYQTQERKIRPSGFYYATICQQNRLLTD